MNISIRHLSKKLRTYAVFQRKAVFSISMGKRLNTYCTAAQAKDEPPPSYTTSKAASWKASESFYGRETDEPWYQFHIIIASTTIFMIYFFILREENDIDEKLSRPMFEAVPATEEVHLTAMINQLKSEGKDYSQYEKRLKQITKTA